MADVPALVVRAPGTNRDEEMAAALERAGAQATRVPLDRLVAEPELLERSRLLVIAGGFSYADALGSGRIAALELAPLADAVRSFVERGCPVLGVCNGFQILVRAGLLPGGDVTVTLARNDTGRFDCRWVHLVAPVSRCAWTSELREPLFVPIAHGEGRLVASAADHARLVDGGQVALRYAMADGSPAHGSHPHNPNGSLDDVAGLCDETGLVLGLMPHPEDHVLVRQHPRRSRGETAGNALPLFLSGVRRAAQS